MLNISSTESAPELNLPPLSGCEGKNNRAPEIWLQLNVILPYLWVRNGDLLLGSRDIIEENKKAWTLYQTLGILRKLDSKRAWIVAKR